MNTLFDTREANAARALFYFMVDRETSTPPRWRAPGATPTSASMTPRSTSALALAADRKARLVDAERERGASTTSSGSSSISSRPWRCARSASPRGAARWSSTTSGSSAQLISDFETIHFHSKPAEKYENFAKFLQYSAEGEYAEGIQSNAYANPDAVRDPHSAQGQGAPMARRCSSRRCCATGSPWRASGGPRPGTCSPATPCATRPATGWPRGRAAALLRRAHPRAEVPLRDLGAGGWQQRAQKPSEFVEWLQGSKWVKRFDRGFGDRPAGDPRRAGEHLQRGALVQRAEVLLRVPLPVQAARALRLQRPARGGVGLRQVAAQRARRGSQARDRGARHGHRRRAGAPRHPPPPPLRVPRAGRPPRVDTPTPARTSPPSRTGDSVRRWRASNQRDTRETSASRARRPRRRAAQRPTSSKNARTTSRSLERSVASSPRSPSSSRSATASRSRAASTSCTDATPERDRHRRPQEHRTRAGRRRHRDAAPHLRARLPRAHRRDADYVEIWELDEERKKPRAVDGDFIDDVKTRVRGAADALRRNHLPVAPWAPRCKSCDYCGMCSAGAPIAAASDVSD
jgi:hypothetical protein